MILKQKRMDMSYEDRLRELNWYTLQSRRKYLLISFVTKCVFGEVTSKIVDKNVFVNTRYQEDVKFRHLLARTQRLYVSPIHEFPRLWEELPQSMRIDLVLCKSLQAWLVRMKHHICTKTIV